MPRRIDDHRRHDERIHSNLCVLCVSVACPPGGGHYVRAWNGELSMSRYLAPVLVGLFAAAVLAAQAPAPGIAAGGPAPLWTISTDLATPESAYFDAASNAVFVSNINGQILEKD